MTMSGKEMNRRSFCGASALATSAWLAAASDVTAGSKKKHRYVDMHTHLGQTWNSTEYLSAEVMLRWMDSSGIEKAVVLPLVSPESSSYPLTADFVLRETQGHRDRLIPFCSVDPRTSYRGGLKGLADMLRRYKDAGAKGFGEHKPGIAVDDPRNMLIYAACAEVKIPLLFHLDNQRNTDKPGLPGLENAIRQNPGCVFIGHGPGWWASISGGLSQQELGGYPKGPTAPGGAIDRLMEKYDNIYGDLSAGSGANSISRDLEFGHKFLVRRQDRIMFGTDYLTPGQEIPQFELFQEKLTLPVAVENKIHRENALRVLGLS